MKNRWLPHLIYGSVLLAAGLFYADKISRAERVNRLLAEPISSAILAVNEWNRELMHLAEKEYLAYKNPTSQRFWKQTLGTDSLTQLALFNLKNRGKTRCGEFESLKNAWFSMIDENEADYFQQIILDNYFSTSNNFSIKNTLFDFASNSDVATFSAKVDSLHFAISETSMLSYLLSKVAGTHCGEFLFEPGISWTTPSPAVGDTLRGEIILAKYSNHQLRRFEMDGSPLKCRDGKAHLDKRFEQPGLWPIHARFWYSIWPSDSLISYEKTFFIRVKN